ncbi:MAG: hypothetical protein U1E65_02950 [Myxococcota bacterium]
MRILLRVLALVLLLSASIYGCSCGSADCTSQKCGEHQLCQEAMGGTPASCQPACESGYAWDGTACVASTLATCLPAPAAGSIALRCTMEHRACTETTPGAATCGACVTDYVDVAGACEPMMSCASLSCAAMNRACSETPNGHCTDCLPGMIEDTPGGACRMVKTCADITCMPGFSCIEMMGADATCRQGDCGPNAAPKANGGGCVACRIDCTNRTGGTGQVYLAHATLADTCICETQPGFFWDDGAPGGGDIRACDADGDGWVRLNAKKALENVADVAMQTNARCTLRRIDTYVLENDQGQSKSVMIDPPIGLYEPERNDDQGLLDDAVRQGTLPTYNGRALKAEELNALTKACAWKQTAQQKADFNENSFEDVDEGHDDPAQVNPNNPLAPFANFSYFIETHRSWYVPPSTRAFGEIHIQEKLRGSVLTDGFALPITYEPAAGGDHWKTCDRKRDATYMPGKPGYDFAKYADASWFGMGHHSQFRCLRLVSQSSGKPNEVTPQEAATDWSISRCTPGATGPAVGPPTPGGNPSDPVMGCTNIPAAQLPDPRTSSTAPVLWGAAKYQPYDDLFTQDYTLASYLRGCVNECGEYPARCPGFNPRVELNTSQCVGTLSNFGALACGCGTNFAGQHCEFSCSGNLTRVTDATGNLFVSTDFDPAPRTGLWMCARPSVTTGDILSAHAATGTSTWSLRGEVPGHVSPVQRLCEDGGPCQVGYALFADPMK